MEIQRKDNPVQILEEIQEHVAIFLRDLVEESLEQSEDWASLPLF